MTYRNKKNFPMSIAIEMELTAKNINRTISNLSRYKNSIKFGAVVWFCGNYNVKKHLYEALDNIGGLGWTKCYILDYTEPRQTSRFLVRDDSDNLIVN
jgi:hypothetical protein